MISMDRVDSIRKKYRRGEPVAAIARELGVCVLTNPSFSAGAVAEALAAKGLLGR